MKTIEYADALRALNEAVKAKGYKYVYPRTERSANYCYNIWNGQPDCIVGTALVWLGVPIEWFEAEPSRENDDVGDVCKALLLDGKFEFTEDAKDLLGQAQTHQDNGIPWGEAVTLAHLGGLTFENLGLHSDVK